jgi:ABC-type amino acid transport system permease subunit
MYNRKKLAFFIKRWHVAVSVFRGMPMVYIILWSVVGMTLLIFSAMPTFTVLLNLKQLSWHVTVQPFFAQYRQ